VLPCAAGVLLLNDTLINCSVSIEQVQHNAEAEPLPFQSGSIDAVFFLEVLEHLQKDPFFAVLEMHRVLKPNGELHLQPMQRQGAFAMEQQGGLSSNHNHAAVKAAAAAAAAAAATPDS
jgi:ubiquinone/menaquinone biosynthesis C-methylase UbiE